jgi:beta-1,4-N-acetylglucosaminyltransferase
VERSAGPAPSDGIDVLLVCSPGGHALQLFLLRDAWEGRSHAWVTLNRDDTATLLAGETTYFAYGPTTRHVPNLLRNLWLAGRLLHRLRPRVIVTTGAALAVPFAWLGRPYGCKVVYVESLTRIEKASLSCRLVAPVADRVYAQWPELVKSLPRARFVGSVLEGR